MEHIGKYEILGELGQGGMGAVYRGRDTVIGRDVAIKVIHKQALGAPDIKKRFYREARSAGRLAHENITVIYDIDEADGAPFLVMEYLDGEDLRTRLDRGRALSNDEKLSIAIQIARGLHYAHEQGIIHRDIKPANIRILPNGRVKIMDFGIARIQNETQALTQTNLSLGTPRYMSPEQIKGEELDRRSDLFSYGVLIYELFTGQNPFMGVMRRPMASGERRLESTVAGVRHSYPAHRQIRSLKAASKRLCLSPSKCITRSRDKASTFRRRSGICSDLGVCNMAPISSMATRLREPFYRFYPYLRVSLARQIRKRSIGFSIPFLVLRCRLPMSFLLP